MIRFLAARLIDAATEEIHPACMAMALYWLAKFAGMGGTKRNLSLLAQNILQKCCWQMCKAFKTKIFPKSCKNYSKTKLMQFRKSPVENNYFPFFFEKARKENG